MSKIVQNQISKIKEEFNCIEDKDSFIFSRKDNAINKREVKVKFEKYFVTGYKGFDFHEKFNKGIYPTDVVMIGTIEKETEKMYYFKLHDETNNRNWEGYCPKKCCKVEEMRMN